jgi:hypothetical protein
MTVQRIAMTAAAAALSLTVASAGHAATVLRNGSFEHPGGVTKLQLADGSTFVDDWVVHGDNTYYETNGQDSVPTAAAGAYWLGFGQSGAHGGSITQSFTSVLGRLYTVNYAFRLQQGDDDDSGFQVSASTGDSVYSGDAVNADWQTGAALHFTGTGGAITITFLDATDVNSGGSSNLALDAVHLSSVGSGTPEPAGWALMILGFGGAGGMMRRRRAYSA